MTQVFERTLWHKHRSGQFFIIAAVIIGIILFGVSRLMITTPVSEFDINTDVPTHNAIVQFVDQLDGLRKTEQNTALELANDWYDRYGFSFSIPSSLQQGAGSDFSGNNHDAAIAGATLVDDGRKGLALDFDGNDVAVVSDNQQLDQTNSFTIESWVRPSSAAVSLNASGNWTVSRADEWARGTFMNTTTEGDAIALQSEVDTGDGSDGSLTVTGTRIINTYAALTQDATAGDTSLTVEDATGFSAEDEILLIQMQNGTGSGIAGQYAFHTISSISGNTMQLESSLDAPYFSGAFANTPQSQGETAKAAQIVRVPQYTNVTINSGIITAPQWDGKTGGIVAFRAIETVSFENGGAVNVSGKGFRGGLCGSCDDDWDGGRGEGIIGWPLGGGKKDYPDAVSLNNGIGGGGNHVDNNDGGDPGAGGGYGTVGETVPDSQSQYDSEGGTSIGNDSLERLFFGGGGGAGADNDGGTPESVGGDGGGIVFIAANTIQNARITSNGEAGKSDCGQDWSGKGGGGAGGSVFVKALDIDLNAVQAQGGDGANDDCDESNGGETGGDGGVGRIRVDAVNVTGTANPSAYRGQPAFAQSGTYLSAPHAAPGPRRWDDNYVTAATSADTNYSIYFGENTSGAWQYHDTVSSLPVTQYIRFQLELHTNNAGRSPTIQLVRLNNTVTTLASGDIIFKEDAYGVRAANGNIKAYVGNTSPVSAPLFPGWQHITFTFNRFATDKTAHLYVNGSLVDSGNYSGFAPETDTPIVFGDRFIGTMDEVYFYDRPLSPAEVEQRYKDNVSITNGLIAHYPFIRGCVDIAVESAQLNAQQTLC